MGINLKTHRTLLPSAARTVATACPQQTDTTEQYARVYLSITAASGTGGLKVQFRGYDKVSGNAVALSQGGAAAITATGMYVYEMMPNSQAAAGSVEETVGRMLPYTWDVSVTVGDASSYTYSLSADVLPG